MCRSMVDIQSPTAEIRREKKRRKKEERNYRMKILWSALLHRATIIRESRKSVGINLMHVYCTFTKRVGLGYVILHRSYVARRSASILDHPTSESSIERYYYGGFAAIIPDRAWCDYVASAITGCCACCAASSC